MPKFRVAVNVTSLEFFEVEAPNLEAVARDWGDLIQNLKPVHVAETCFERNYNSQDGIDPVLGDKE